MSNRREDLTFRWGIDADAFRRQLTKVNADVQKSTDTIKGQIAQAFTISAAALAFKEIGEAMLELRRKSEDLGASVEFLQGVGRLSTFFGGTAERTDAALQKLVTSIGTARTEGGPMAEAFERFGISLYTVNNEAKTTEEVFKDIANAYKNSTDAATKSALAFEFFGKTGKDINNILDLGSDGIAKYVADSKGLGITAVENVNALADAWLTVKAAFQGTGVFANALGWVTRVVGSAAATLGALAGGATLEQAQGIAGSQDADLARQEQERERNAREADAILRAAKQREQLAKAAESFVTVSNQGAEIEGKKKLLGLTLQELALRARVLISPSGSKQQAAAERDLLNIIGQRAAQERKMQADKLTVLKNEELDLAQRLVMEDDLLKKEQLKLDIKKKQNEIAAQALAVGEQEAKVLADRNRLMADQRSAADRKEDRTRYTLAELAGANIRGLQRQGAPQSVIDDALKAQEVARLIGADPNKLGGQAEAARLRGDRAGAERLISQAENIKAGIGSLRTSERTSEIAEATKKTALEIAEFNRMAKNEGQKVRPILAP